MLVHGLTTVTTRGKQKAADPSQIQTYTCTHSKGSIIHAPVVSSQSFLSCVYNHLLGSSDKCQGALKCLTFKHLAERHFKATAGLKLKFGQQMLNTTGAQQC